MISLFRVLGLLMPVVAAVSMLAGSTRDSVCATGDSRDVTIVGRGYFSVLNESTQSVEYTRNLRLQLDIYGYLCHASGSKLMRLDPPIAVPSDWTRLDISPEGIVTCTLSGMPSMQIGEVQVSCFANDGFTRVNSRSASTNSETVPYVGQAGSGGVGQIWQGYSTQLTVPFQTSNVIVLVTLFTYLFGVAGYWTYLRPRSDR